MGIAIGKMGRRAEWKVRVFSLQDGSGKLGVRAWCRG